MYRSPAVHGPVQQLRRRCGARSPAATRRRARKAHRSRRVTVGATLAELRAGRAASRGRGPSTISPEESGMSFSSGFKTQALIAPTLAMFTLFGCGTSGEPPSGNVEVQATNVSSLSGEQLYRGIILADGPVADLLPEIRDNVKLDNFITDKEQLATISKANDQVVDQVRKVRPDFFGSFKKDIQSGDHLLIRRGMQDALTLTQAVVSKLPGAGDVDKQAGDEQTDAKRIESFEQLKAEIAAEVHQSKI